MAAIPMWVSINEYCKIEGISRQAAYKRMKAEKVKVNLNDKGRKLLFVEDEKVDSGTPIVENKSSKSISKNDDIKLVLEKLEEAHHREIENLKDTITRQDVLIQELKAENEKLKLDIKSQSKIKNADKTSVKLLEKSPDKVEKPKLYRTAVATQMKPNTQKKDTEKKKQKTIKVRVTLRVERNSKFVRGMKKSRQEIEMYVLSDYNMRRSKNNDHEYILTIPYETEEELERIIDDIYTEMQSTAECNNCWTEADIYTLDGSKSW